MEERIISTDSTFFDDMRAKERKILEKLGVDEALKILDEEDTNAQREYETDVDSI